MGEPKLISTQTASGSTSVSFTSGIDSTYDKYMFMWIDINPSSDGAQFQFQANVDGESGYNETITTSTFHAYHNEDDSAALLQYNPWMDQAQGTSFQTISPNLGNGSDESGAGGLYLFAPSSTTYVTQIYGRSQNHDNSNNCQDFYVAGYFNVTGAITQIQFKISTGSFDGKITLYGVG